MFKERGLVMQNPNIMIFIITISDICGKRV